MSNREELRKKFLEPKEEDKKEIEVEDLTLKMEPISIKDSQELVEDIQDPEKEDMRCILECIVEHTYDEEGELFLDKDDVDELLDRPQNDPYVKGLVHGFNEVNDFDDLLEFS